MPALMHRECSAAASHGCRHRVMKITAPTAISSHPLGETGGPVACVHVAKSHVETQKHD